LEVLESLGVTDRLISEGVVVPVFSVRDRDRVLTRVDFGRLPTRFPFTLMVPQSITEAILLERLRELGGEVYRPMVVTDLQRDSSGVTALISADGQTQRTVRTRYVVGADGMNSTVREQAGIGFEGKSYDQSFVLADVRLDWPLRSDEVMLFFSPQGLVVVAPLPGGRHRVVATEDNAPKQPGIADIQRLLDERGPSVEAARVEEVVWSSRFQVHHRIAQRYRAGRILLAGDAAHVHSPAGGQGMNTGIQDAIELGHALVAALQYGAGDEPITDYERHRRPIAQRVVNFTDRMTRAATLHNRPARSLRNAAIQAVGRIPAVRQQLAIELAELGNR
jgi:2-polyprenyl-6-methoxyphenol hydroxylase-like FAD-dependent oxidoreductase